GNRMPVRRKKNDEELELYVDTNSGMMGVIPAWKLHKFLYRRDLVTERKKIEENAIQSAIDNKPGGFISAKASSEDEDVITRAEFEEALRKVSRPTQSPSRRGKESPKTSE
ncbi:MAG: hypothetical protein KC547_18835, partial [Anaerolineae bacterium]|nr:hypothetical protein [Anaerolineae bacterium]